MNEAFSGGDIDAPLLDLDRELERRGARADLFLVGGAAIAVAHDSQRSTRDLDAFFEPTTVVREAAAVVGRARGLPDGWLNDAVKGSLPGTDAEAQRHFEGAALNVDVAPARYLLALKLFASRVETDADDIAFLYRQVGFTTVEEGLALWSRPIGGSRSPRAPSSSSRRSSRTSTTDQGPVAPERPSSTPAAVAPLAGPAAWDDDARATRLLDDRQRRLHREPGLHRP